MSGPPSDNGNLGGHSLVDPPRQGHALEGGEDLAIQPTAIREVMACIDGSPLGCGVIPHAALIARALGARLTLLRVLEAEQGDWSVAPDPVEWGILQREARAHLDEMTARLAPLDPGVRSELIQGRAAEQICHWAEQHHVDLTVLCSHGASGHSEWDLASTARKLIDHTPGSLLLVPADVADHGNDVAYRRILVPLDGSPRAESAIPIAMRIAADQDAEVLFVHVVSMPEIIQIGPLDAEGAELERRVIEHNERIAGTYLDRIRGRVSQSGPRVRALVVGNGSSVRTRLTRLIRDEQVDLVVLSAHGYTGRLDVPCGSVAAHVLTHARTPCLMLRGRDHRRMRRAGESAVRSLKRHSAPGAVSS